MKWLSRYQDLAYALLRIVAGFLFLQHGLQKTFGLLGGKVATAPHFFQQTAICLDLKELEAEPDAATVRGIIEAIRRSGMLVVGFAEGAANAALAKVTGLPVIGGFRPQNTPALVAAGMQTVPSRS